MNRQFTSTVYIIENFKVLLVFHRKLQKWLPPGGHVDEDELPHEAAIREAKEETGLDIELCLQENVWIDSWNAKSLPRPYLFLLEEIPAFNGMPAHQHIDMIFVGKPTGGSLFFNERESHDVRWFEASEIMALKSDQDIFKETQDVILHLCLSKALPA